MIVLFTSNTEGGIVQLTIQLLTTLIDIGEEALVFIPEGSKYTLDERYYPYIRKYIKVKTLLIEDKRILNIAHEIIKNNPSAIIFTDNEVVSAQVLLNIQKSAKTVLCIHDVIPHLSYINLRNYLVNKLKSWLNNMAIKKSDYILLFSENSRKKFQEKYKGFSMKKLLVLPLGAHVPQIEARKPTEIDSSLSEYFLFFGRLDKYKGIYKLIDAYNNLSIDNKPKLIIAGNGELSIEERNLIDENKNIILIKRFIKDEEMIYLYKFSLGVILPYIEASQSGVLAISYHFNIPVVVSDLPGLTEFVNDRKTGYICKTEKDITLSLEELCNKETVNNMKVNIRSYYENNLSWDKNIYKIVQILNKVDEQMLI